MFVEDFTEKPFAMKVHHVDTFYQVHDSLLAREDRDFYPRSVSVEIGDSKISQEKNLGSLHPYDCFLESFVLCFL